jgi:hypothetical protein
VEVVEDTFVDVLMVLLFGIVITDDEVEVLVFEVEAGFELGGEVDVEVVAIGK